MIVSVCMLCCCHSQSMAAACRCHTRLRTLPACLVAHHPSCLFSASPLQYLYLLLSVAVLLPISLGVDGTDWAANFRGWTAGDWAVLCVMSCCVVISANLCIQYRCAAALCCRCFARWCTACRACHKNNEGERLVL